MTTNREPNGRKDDGWSAGGVGGKREMSAGGWSMDQPHKGIGYEDALQSLCVCIGEMPDQ